MAKFGRGVGSILVAGLVLAACSSSPQDSLANDQRAVDSAQAAVDRDQAALAPYTDPSTSQAIACATLPSTTTPTTALTNCPDSPTESQLEAKLKADEFKLQVAQDQLKKDESGG